ncbi:MAG TPA: DUF3822 family protein [Bacteroidia bacterium]
MLLPVETGSKKHVIAERLLDNGVPLNLCNLFVSDYGHVKILSLYSALSKKFLGYKVFNTLEIDSDDWLYDQKLNNIYHCDFNPDVNLIPSVFAGQSEYSTSNQNFALEANLKNNHIHFLNGLSAYFANSNGSDLVLMLHHDLLSIASFSKGKCMFYNVFPCNDLTELLYFTVSSLNTAGLPQLETHLYLDLHTSQVKGLKELLEPHFNQVDVLKIPSGNPDQAIDHLPELLFFNYAVSLCV